jgi:ATP-dependent Zn protease
MIFKLFATTLFINRIQGFQFIKPLTAIQNHKHATTVKMILNEKDFSNELKLIQNYKFYFTKENYNDVIEDLLNNKLSKIYVDNKYNQVVTVDNLPQTDILYNHYHLSDINTAVVPNLIQKTSESHVPIYFVNFIPQSITNIQNLAGELLTLASYALPIFFLLSFLTSLYRANTMQGMNPKMNSKLNSKLQQSRNGNGFGGSPMGPFGFPSSQQKTEQFVKPNVSLASWAGSPEVIEECKEVISYIEKKELYKTIGAEMPKGILLEGPPGTGKTLLAKAIATETNSTFISMSGSEFVELFVGMGASRVRDLFDSARENRPCIIFID